LKQRLPPAPVIAATFSGFILGIMFTLLLTGTVFRASNGPPATTTPSTVIPRNLISAPTGMYDKVRRMLVRQLGPAYPDTRVQRLVQLDLLPSESDQANSQGYRSLLVIFRLNDHPLGKVWRLRAAEADIFEVMKALYTSQLPIYSVRMEGLFPLQVNNHTQLVRALRAFMTHKAAARIQWDHWDRNRDTEARLWKLMTQKFVAKGFA
jgi:hypothetical protein